MVKVWILLQWFGAPAIMAVVSVIYFFTDQRRPAYGARLISSAHGAIGVLLYFGAMAFQWGRPLEYRPNLAMPYAALYLLPLVAIIVALFTFHGPRFIHLLQIANLLALTWALFIGGMAITGDWL